MFQRSVASSFSLLVQADQAPFLSFCYSRNSEKIGNEKRPYHAMRQSCMPRVNELLLGFVRYWGRCGTSVIISGGVR